ncbi:MAG: L-histidine N(alpha)-methyltransferase [Candidatus Poribacteria bacterium]|nr:L-histidine N(alpha)-methyltransferase [Candidatus Poribacteria bacterium]
MENGTPPVDSLRAAFIEDVRAGLTSKPKTVPPRYFYDAKGSRLFEEICGLPEYYLTRAEFEILRGYADRAAAQFREPVALVELGSGSSVKTRLLIEAFLRQHGALRYVPIDISAAILEESSAALRHEYPRLEIQPVTGEYAVGFQQLAAETDRPKLILFLGSNIGNMNPDEALAFLRRMRGSMSNGDRALVGIDLRKSRGVLEAAYDDAAGVTAQFNMNLLERINRELRGNFNLERFVHRAFYNSAEGRMEMHLVSLKAQRVQIEAAEMETEFAKGETIHTENSYKFTLQQIDALAEASGFVVETRWFDSGRRFSLNCLAPDA